MRHLTHLLGRWSPSTQPTSDWSLPANRPASRIVAVAARRFWMARAVAGRQVKPRCANSIFHSGLPDSGFCRSPALGPGRHSRLRRIGTDGGGSKRQLRGFPAASVELCPEDWSGTFWGRSSPVEDSGTSRGAAAGLRSAQDGHDCIYFSVELVGAKIARLKSERK